MAQEIISAQSVVIEESAPQNDSFSEQAGVARASSIVALGNISSRILGLVREIILSNLFGAGAAVDAFKLAIIIPRSLYDLLIGGHVNSALIPVMSEYAHRQNREDLWELVNALLGAVIVILLGLVLVIEVGAEALIRLAAGNERPETLAQAVNMLRLTTPALLFLSLFAVLSGLLYALRRFTLPAFGATVFNLMIVVTTILLADQIGIRAAALGWLLGAIVQATIQLLQLRDAKLWPKFRGILAHRGVRTIGLLYLPVMASLALDVLVNRFFSYSLAFRTGESNISYMEWGTTLIQFPHGLVATAISIAVLPTLSRQAASQDNHAADDYKNTLGFGLRLATVLILPATIGLFVLATPVVALIFEHGKFTPQDTEATVDVLRLYLIGLPFATIDLLLVFAFYARQDTLTPALIGLITLIAYMFTAIALLPYIGFLSLMVADSVKHILHSSISSGILLRRIGHMRDQRLFDTGIRTLIAATIMGAITYVVMQFFLRQLPTSTLLAEIIHVSVPALVGMLTFALVGYILRLQELQWFFGFLRRRVKL